MWHIFLYFPLFLSRATILLVSLAKILSKCSEIIEYEISFLVHTVTVRIFTSFGTFGGGSNSTLAVFRHEFIAFSSLSFLWEVFICETLPNLPFESRLLNREAMFVLKLLFNLTFKFPACFPHARNFPASTNFPRKHEPAFSLPVPCLTNYREPP